MLPCQPLSIFQKSALKMERSAMVDHINTISKQATTCTLITNLGEKKEVGGLNFFLMPEFAFSNISRCKPYFWPPSALIWDLCFPRYYLRSLKKIQVQLILTKPFWTCPLPGWRLSLHLLALLLLHHLLFHHQPAWWTCPWGGGAAASCPSWCTSSTMEKPLWT